MWRFSYGMTEGCRRAQEIPIIGKIGAKRDFVCVCDRDSGSHPDKKEQGVL